MDDTKWKSVLQYVSNDVLSPPSKLPVSKMSGVPLNIEHPTPIQVPSPPGSGEACHSPLGFQKGLPQDNLPGNMTQSVSTTFHPGAALLPIPSDLIFLSADGVFFYVHTTQVLALTTNYFDGLVPPKAHKSTVHDDLRPVVPLPESASVLNIVFHVVYDLSCAHYHPAVDTLVAAVDIMAKYGLPPKQHITPYAPLYSILLNQAPMQPISVYAVAAAHDLYDLALQVSSHLLSFGLDTLTDDLAIRIGPVYIKLLFFLHLGRIDALKRLLLPRPHPHPPTPSCDFTEQKKLTSAWTLASAYLVWNARPDLSASAMEEAILPLRDHLSCDMCRQSLVDRVRELIVQWSMVKRSI